MIFTRLDYAGLRFIHAYAFQAAYGRRGRLVHLRVFDHGMGGHIFRRKRRKGEHPQQRHHKTRVFIGGERQILFAVQRALVVELDLLAVERAGKGLQAVVFGVICGDGGGHGLQQGDALQQQGKLA